MMVEPNALDVTLVDEELLAEMDLATEVMIAVQAFARPLTLEELDGLLQVRPQSDDASAR